MLKRLWQGLTRPSLGRRIALVLLAALPLVGLEILGWNYLEIRRAMEPHVGGQIAARYFSQRLSEAPEAEREVVLRTLVEDANHWRRAERNHWQGELRLLWRAADGQIRYESHPRSRAALLALAPGRGERELEGQAHWAYRQDGALGSVHVLEPVRDAGAKLHRIARQTLFYLLIAFPVVLLPLWWGLRRGLKPLRDFVHQLARRDAQDLHPLEVKLPQAELQPLGQAFDAMLERLRQQRERERQFVQEAAHELRTPLAVISAQAHVLRQAGDAVQREQAALALDGAVARAAHLSRQLLTLASVESLEAVAAERSSDLAEQTRAQLVELLPLAEARRISLVLEAPEQLPSGIPLPLWGSLLGNLVDNALRYCPEGSRVEVHLSEQHQGLSLRVADDGPGIAESERARVFDRFWRADQTQASGSGLGLAIVRQIVQGLGGTIVLGPGIDGRGVAFSVSGLAAARAR